MKYSTKPREITESFWDGAVAIAAGRNEEIQILREGNCRKITFPVDKTESRTAILSCYAPDGGETEISAYHEKEGKITLSIHDPEGRKEAIRRAIRDLMARTLTRKKENKDQDFNQAIEDALLPEINKWLDDSRTDFSEEAFDTWHAGACKAVLTALREYYTNNDKAETDVQYGKAQKIVNMTMKGLYCLRDADNKASYFDHCHIPLDSFTLEWIQRNIFVPRDKVRKYLASHLQSWSAPEQFRKYRLSEEDTEVEDDLRWVIEDWEGKLTKLDDLLSVYDQRRDNKMNANDAKRLWRGELTKLTAEWLSSRFVKGKVSKWGLIPDETTSFYGYGEYVRWVRIYFASNHTYMDEDAQKPLTPFQAEFYIWPEIQLRLTAESFIFELNSDKYKGKEPDPSRERADIIDLPLAKLLERVTHEIREYEEKHT